MMNGPVHLHFVLLRSVQCCQVLASAGSIAGLQSCVHMLALPVLMTSVLGFFFTPVSHKVTEVTKVSLNLRRLMQTQLRTVVRREASFWGVTVFFSVWSGSMSLARIPIVFLPNPGSTVIQQPANGVFPDPDSVKEEPFSVSLVAVRRVADVSPNFVCLSLCCTITCHDISQQAVRDLLEQKKYNVQDFYKTVAWQ